MTKYKTIFIDLDDTLIDTKKNSYLGLYELYNLYQFEKYYDTFASFEQKYQKVNTDLWHLYDLGQIGKEELQTQRFNLTLKEEYKDLTEERALQINKTFMKLVSEKDNIVEGAIDILDYLKQKEYSLNVLSNGFKEIQNIKIKKAKMTDYFDHVILSDHIGKNKPHPDLFQHALDITNGLKENTIMIGDNINTDILGAKQSNIDQIWLNIDARKDLDITPTFEINTLKEIREIL